MFNNLISPERANNMIKLKIKIKTKVIFLGLLSILIGVTPIIFIGISERETILEVLKFLHCSVEQGVFIALSQMVVFCSMGAILLAGYMNNKIV